MPTDPAELIGQRVRVTRSIDPRYYKGAAGDQRKATFEGVLLRVTPLTLEIQGHGLIAAGTAGGYFESYSLTAVTEGP